MRTVRYLTLALLSVLLLSVAMPGSGTEDAPAEVTETTVDADTSLQPGYEPAVVIAPAVDTPADQAWTTKFLVPTGLLIAAVAMLATVVMYFVRVVRTRYKVVE
jgi:hypothetical protein